MRWSMLPTSRTINLNSTVQFFKHQVCPSSGYQLPAVREKTLAHNRQVSDREAVVNILSEESYLASLSFCKSWIDEGKGEEVIPIEYRSLFQDYPVSAQRWYDPERGYLFVTSLLIGFQVQSDRPPRA